jgi:hypothetical protein
MLSAFEFASSNRAAAQAAGTLLTVSLNLARNPIPIGS